MFRNYCISIVRVLVVSSVFIAFYYAFMEPSNSVKLMSKIYSVDQPQIDIGYPRRICNCPIREHTMPEQKPLSFGQVSHCSKEASEFGKGQKVISFSLFVNDPDSVTLFLNQTQTDLLLQEIRFIFPGWLVRIYSNITTIRRNTGACNLVCQEDFIFWCDILDIPGMGNMMKLNPRSWRFLVMNDPTVDIFLSRDLDSQVTSRERMAVAEWEVSNLPFHAMRDHPHHTVGMLGGLWGAKNNRIPPTVRQNITRMLIASGQITQDKGWDQHTVIQYIYAPFHHLVMVHDSYFCGKYPDSKTLPFSMQRHKGEMIGARNFGNASTMQVCPVACRPAHGKHWERC